jgi:choline dehydrogenase-like flavoprotein
MRSSPARDRAVACQMIGEDLAQLANTVDLDPTVKDIYGLPVARITYSTHLYERLASWYWGPRLADIIKAAGGEQVYFLPSDLNALAGGNPIAADTRHISGTMRMGTDPETSVVDEFGRMWAHDNVVVCDGSVFPSAGAVNPTNTIMSVALRSATAAAYGEDQARRGPVPLT